MIAMRSAYADAQFQLQAAFTERCIQKIITRLHDFEPDESPAVPQGLTSYWDSYFRDQPPHSTRSLSPTPSEPNVCSDSNNKEQRHQSNNGNERGIRAKPTATQSKVQKYRKESARKKRRSHNMITRRRVTDDTKFYHLDRLPT